MAVTLENKVVPGSSFQYPPFQKALPYFPNYGYQVTIYFKDDAPLDKTTQSLLMQLVQKLNDECAKIDGQYPTNGGKKVPHSGFNVGFELNFWQQWCGLLGRKPSAPVVEATNMMNSDSDNFMKAQRKLRYTKGHMWIYLKAESEKNSEALLKVVKDGVISLPPHRLLVTTAYKKNEGRVFGGQFLDGISNAVDAISMARKVLILPTPVSSGEVSPEGGTFAFVQFFQFDKSVFTEAPQPVSEHMIGRDTNYSEALARPTERCHIKRARLIDAKDGTNTELIRQSLPFMPPKRGGKDRGPVGEGIFFVAFGQSSTVFANILDNILGDERSVFTKDLLISNVQGRFGKLFYCPNTNELAELPKFTETDLYPPIPFWSKTKSKNEAYFYNHIQYLYTMSTGYKPGDPPSKRILYLMSKAFSLWHSTWVHKFDVPRIPHLKEFLDTRERFLMDRPIQERKGYSHFKMLSEVFSTHKKLPDASGIVYSYSENFDTYRIDSQELIVGVTETLSLGSGKEVMPYLREDNGERDLSFSLGLAEDGNMGHIVPGHNYLLDLGVKGMLEKLKQLKTKALGEPGATDTSDKVVFYQAAIYSYEGVKRYLKHYAELAQKTINEATEETDTKNLEFIVKRMMRLANGNPQDFTFHDAAQMIYSMHCCLHLCGQAVSVGRLDQLLIKYYKKDIQNNVLTPEHAQDIIDAFFIKFDEKVVMNRYNIPYGHTTYGSTAVTGRGGPFPTGDSMNQWIQQITLGGCDDTGNDACNEVTLMCLKACRRLPLNSPCISLRLSENTPTEVKQEAVAALLSGGAHPILFHDKKMIAGLHDVLNQSYVRSGISIDRDLMKVARNFSCDGCYEPMYTGMSEFKFSYVFILKAVIFTINSGADYQPASPLHLAGGVSSHRTALPEDINTFEKFQEIFLEHLKIMIEGTYGLILSSYGNPWKICPSPLLSCLLEGCLESGKDMTNGGSSFHILTPMYVGFTNTVNSLYNVKKMVYSDNDVTTLDNLKMALINNWGENMVEPFFDTTGEGTVHTLMAAQKFKDLRDYALTLPKFGRNTDDAEINELAQWLAVEMNKIAYDVLYEPGSVNDMYNDLKKKHSVPGKPFLFQVMTGSGTFESYVSVGASCAATPDGRLSGQPTASDCSSQPYPQDRPVPNDETFDIIDALKPYDTYELDKHIPNGCEVDLNIPEDFPPEELMKFVDAFIKGETGSNLVTVTCANRETLEMARLQPQKFDLVRNRMGGWSNFFVSMFNEHQLQHIRRPMFRPHGSQ